MRSLLFPLVLSSNARESSTGALQLIHKWRASKGSILAAETFIEIKSGRRILATGGHSDDGRIRFWELGTSGTGLGSFNAQCSAEGIGVEAHSGSIFSLSHVNDVRRSESYLVSGSFDRSAAIHRVVPLPGEEGENNTFDAKLETVGVLPEHTGWVRGVQAVQHSTKCDAGNEISILSIGCNLINVWLINYLDRSVVRLARLDAGPSPDDPPEETFRRHDILSIAVVGDDENIVAGLVDGTVRVFDAKFDTWYSRSEQSPYDATGSCDCVKVPDKEGVGTLVEDEKPVLSANAHSGRVTSVLGIPGSSDFVSVGHDGRWIRWAIDKDGGSLSQVLEGYVPPAAAESDNDEGSRICSACISASRQSKECNLYVGTINGCLHKANASEGGKCERVWGGHDENSSSNEKCCPISAITCMEKEDSLVLIVCRSDGEVMTFREH